MDTARKFRKSLSQLPRIEHPVGSPAGTDVAFFAQISDSYELYIIRDGEETEIQLTDGEIPEKPAGTVPVWGPRGQTLYFNGRADADRKSTLRKVARDGESIVLTTELAPVDIRPDGQAILCSKGGALWEYDLRTETSDPIAPYPGHVPQGCPQYSPDGTLIAYTGNETDHPGRSHVYLADPIEQSHRRLSVGTETAETAVRDWHPDGQSVLISDRGSPPRVGIYDIETETTDWFTDPRLIRPLAFLPPSRKFLCGGPTGVPALVCKPDGSIREADLDGSVVFPPSLGDEILLDRTTFVCRREGETRPMQIVAHDVGTGESVILYNTQPEEISPEIFCASTEVTYPGIDDSYSGYLYDSDERPSPAIVWTYGAQSGARARFDPRVQYLVNRGYTVFRPEHGGKKLQVNEDFAAAGRWLQSQEWIDDSRLAIFGHSHGGYDVYLQLATNPDLWDAGIAWQGPADFMALEEGSFLYEFVAKEFGPRSANRDQWKTRSPISHVEEFKNPILILHGTEDQTVPISQARSLRDALVANDWEPGKDFEYKELAAEHCGLDETEAIVAGSHRIAEFLDQFLFV